MRRGTTLTLMAACVGLLVSTGSLSASAADAPGAPPIAAGTQPSSASVGSSASVATGRSSSSAQGQTPSNGICAHGGAPPRNCHRPPPPPAPTPPPPPPPP